MIFDAISSASHAAFTWTLTTSLAATVLVALIVLVQILFRKVLPARWRYVPQRSRWADIPCFPPRLTFQLRFL